MAQVGTDPRRRAREIANAQVAFLAAGRLTGPTIRDLVAESWARSPATLRERPGEPPVVLADDELETYRAAHPLARVLGVLRQLVGAVADDGDHLMAVSDDVGRLLWVEGHRVIRSKAERMGFVAGSWWDEAHAGTNAPGTALALDHEVQIFATEHFLPNVQKWSCSAAPIHDPATGRVLGVVDITGGDGVAGPLSLGLVRAAARAAEAELRNDLWLPPLPGTSVRLSALGRDECLVDIDGQVTRLHRRHSDIVVMLALRPGGMTGEQLATWLYDDFANPVTLRAEMTRLRRLVGGVLESRPYRLVGRLASDFGDVAAALHAGDLVRALAGWTGPLLPASAAPGVVEHRTWLETQLRAAVLASSDAAPIRRWADAAGFDDLRVWERLAEVSPVISSNRVLAASRIQRLRTEYGLQR